jgi:hypothetical protein
MSSTEQQELVQTLAHTSHKNRLYYSNRKVGMAAMAASVLVFGLAVMPFAFSNALPIWTELKDARQTIRRITQKSGQKTNR